MFACDVDSQSKRCNVLVTEFVEELDIVFVKVRSVIE